MKHTITNLKTTEKLDVTLTLILKELQQSSDRVLWNKRRHRITEQWQNVAAMYDRILLIMFMAGILGVSIWFITLSPIDDHAET